MVTISNDSKNDVTITNEGKQTGGTFADFPIPFAEMNSPWAQPGTAIKKDSKNNVTITNDSKS